MYVFLFMCMHFCSRFGGLVQVYLSLSGFHLHDQQCHLILRLYRSSKDPLKSISKAFKSFMIVFLCRMIMYVAFFQLGAMLGARSISHLEKISSTGMKAMAEKQIVAVLLPTTAYILRLEPPPVRKMIEEGIGI